MISKNLFFELRSLSLMYFSSSYLNLFKSLVNFRATVRPWLCNWQMVASELESNILEKLYLGHYFDIIKRSCTFAMVENDTQIS